jgi:Predicted glycosyltransferases
MSKIGIVIVNYNGEKYQNDCIKSIMLQTYTDFEIIVVDSLSSDNSIEKLKSNYPSVKVIMCNENVGVAKGNNLGIKESINDGCDYTLLLNNDVEMPSDLLQILISKAAENIVVVPKIYYFQPNDLLWFDGGNINWKKGIAEHWGFQKKDIESHNPEQYINYSPTCCMLINNKEFEKIGYIDEKYFMYYDDTDLCVRLSEQNIKILYVPSAKLYHKVSSSTGGENSKLKIYYQSRNQLYFINKFKYNISIYTKNTY